MPSGKSNQAGHNLTLNFKVKPFRAAETKYGSLFLISQKSAKKTGKPDKGWAPR